MIGITRSLTGFIICIDKRDDIGISFWHRLFVPYLTLVYSLALNDLFGGSGCSDSEQDIEL